MASIRCAHCTGTHDSVAAVRACANPTTRQAPVLTDALPVPPMEGLSPAELREWAERFTAFADAREAQYLADERDRRTTARDAVLPEQRSGFDWSQISALRDQVQAHLHREERKRQVGYFAVLDSAASAVKFYRVRTGRKGGRWAGHVFIDAQASDEYWPVKNPHAIQLVLEGIMADPEAAALLYATELGRCCRCARTLTDETSRARGIGPECYKKG